MLTNLVQKVDVDFRIRIFTNLLWDVLLYVESNSTYNTPDLICKMSEGGSNIVLCVCIISMYDSVIKSRLRKTEIEM